MALVTTFTTTPLLNLITKIFPEKARVEAHKIQHVLGIFKTMIAMGNPENGKALLNVAKTVLAGDRNILSVNILHLTPGADTNPIYSEKYAVESFDKIKTEAARLEIPISTDHRVTDNIEHDIIQEVNYHNFDFLLVGAGVSMLNDADFSSKNQIFAKIPVLNKVSDIFYPGMLIRDKTKYFIEHSACSVGVFVNRHFNEISTTVILLYHETDDFLLRYARRLLRNSSAITIFLVDFNGLLEKSEAMHDSFDEVRAVFPRAIKVLKNSASVDALLPKFSFMLTSYQTWNTLTEQKNTLLAHIPSTLIINKKESKFRKMAE
jgi:hypothetical protein